MIKKFIQYNESIKSLLVGPTKEEVFKNFEGMTPDELLEVSAYKNFVEGAEKSLEDGVDLNSENTLNIFLQSIFIGSIDVAMFLIHKGINIYYKHGLALQWEAEGNYTELVKLLLQNGIKYTKVDLYNAYTYARRKGESESSYLILNYINKKKLQLPKK